MMTLDHAPLAPFMAERLPGMAPLAMSDWLHRDDVFAAQMAYRDQLVKERPDIVLAGEGAGGAADLHALLLARLAANPAYVVMTDAVRRPDGVTVPLDPARPFATMARLVQEDLLLLEKPDGGAEHVLKGAALLFPSRWSLAEKMDQPLLSIHRDVPLYDMSLATRVQRLFDHIRPGAPLQRANWLVHPTPELHQPGGSAGAERREHGDTGRYWLRVERQCILALPGVAAGPRRAVFSVKTLITPVERLSREQRQGLAAALRAQSDGMRAYHGGAAFNQAAEAAISAMDF